VSKCRSFCERLGGVAAVLFLGWCLWDNPKTSGAEDLTEGPRLLDALEAAIDSIKSFEVHIQAKQETNFDEQIIENDKVKKALNVFPVPKVRSTRSRQLFSNGWRRIEKVDPKTGELLEVLGADNEVERILSNQKFEGIVRRAGMPVGIAYGSDYQETFRSVYGPIQIRQVFHERIKEMRVRREGEGSRYLVLEVDPTPKRGITYGGWGYRVYADTAANLLPAIIETFDMKDGERFLTARMTVRERKKIAPGVEVPVRAVTEYFGIVKELGKYQQVAATVELTVDVARSRWNEPIAEEAFRVPFPAGLKVLDEIHDMAYVTGKADPGRNLDDLAANARGLITNIRPALPRPSYAWLWWLAVAAGGGLAALLGFFFYRRRTARTSS
jgi:hypothetical protein